MTKRVLILGASGMLGHTMFRYFFKRADYLTFGTLRDKNAFSYFTKEQQTQLLPGVNVLDPNSLLQALTTVKPDILINCVGVIKQLDAAKEPLQTIPINALLPHQLAQYCELIQCRLVHISTDCVFSGEKGNYHEQDASNAEDLYGKSKYLGELHHNAHAVTLRTSIIGHELNSQHSLVDWFLSQSKPIKGFTKAIFSGVPTVELAEIIANHVIPNPKLQGLYHVAAEPIDKCTLLKLIAEVYNKTIDINPCNSLVIDRSLNATRFLEATGYTAPTWPNLILKMKQA